MYENRVEIYKNFFEIPEFCYLANEEIQPQNEEWRIIIIQNIQGILYIPALYFLISPKVKE